jgi:hypothetical protein
MLCYPELSLETLKFVNEEAYSTRYQNPTEYIEHRFSESRPKSMDRLIRSVCDDIDFIKDYGEGGERDTQWRYEAAMTLMRCCTNTLLNALLEGNGPQLEPDHGRLKKLYSEQLVAALKRADTQLVEVLGQMLTIVSFDLEASEEGFRASYQKLQWHFEIRDYNEYTKEFLVTFRRT